MGRRAKMGAGQLQGMSRQQVSGSVKVALEGQLTVVVDVALVMSNVVEPEEPLWLASPA